MATEEYDFHGQINFWRHNPDNNWNIQVQPAEGGTQSGTISDKGYDLISELLSGTNEPLTKAREDSFPARITIDGEEYVYKNAIPDSRGIERVAAYIASTLPHRKYEVRECEEGHYEGGWIVYAGPRLGRDEDEVLAELEEQF